MGPGMSPAHTAAVPVATAHTAGLTTPPRPSGGGRHGKSPSDARGHVGSELARSVAPPESAGQRPERPVPKGPDGPDADGHVVWTPRTIRTPPGTS